MNRHATGAVERILFLEVAGDYKAEIQQARRFEKNYLLYGTNLEDVLLNIDAAGNALVQNTSITTGTGEDVDVDVDEAWCLVHATHMTADELEAAAADARMDTTLTSYFVTRWIENKSQESLCD